MNFHYLIALLNKRGVFVTGGLIRWIYKREKTINYDTFVKSNTGTANFREIHLLSELRAYCFGLFSLSDFTNL